MMRRTTLLQVMIVLLGPGAGLSICFDETGHQVAALLAYRKLSANYPGIKAKIQDILKKHPHFDEFLTKDKPTDVSMDEWVVRRAAIWPDWVRDKPDFHRPTWHYVNKPLLEIGADDRETRLKVEKSFSSRKENHGDIFTAYPDCRRMLRDPETTEADRAIRLCWILHLVADIHQPLHATALCTKSFPGGDAGGNMLYVRRHSGGRSLTLHSYWDNILDSGGPADIEFISRDIEMNVAVAENERAVSEIGTWAEESYELARDFAYRQNGGLIDFILDPDPADNHPPTDAPKLNSEYEEKSREIGRKRIHVAAYRLAAVLVADLSE